MKKFKSTDPFELRPCLVGMGVFITEAYYYILDLCYYLTFKKSLKLMDREFYDPLLTPIIEIEFYKDIDDPIVRNGHDAGTLLTDYLYPFLLRNGLDEAEIFNEDLWIGQANRYATYGSYALRKSYPQTALIYQRFLEGLSKSFYYYACALTMQSYQIPKHMRTAIDYSPQGSFKWLNVELYEVQSLVELIEALQEEEAKLKEIMTRKR